MVAAVVVVGLILIWSLLRWDPVDKPEEAESEPPPPAAEPALAANRVEPVEPAASPDEPAPAPAPTPAPEPPPVKDNANNAAAWPVPEMGGPIHEYKNQFESEPTDSNAVAAESAIHTGFSGQALSSGLLDSVLCHTLVCRVRMRWTQERAVHFMGGLMHVVTDPADNVEFENTLAIDQPQDPNAAGERMVDVYVRLKKPVAH